MRKIPAINAAIDTLAQHFGYQFIDFFPEFADGDRTLRPEFTNDDLHLLDAGYTLW
jgi:lysophospholipase L1-like esterase